MPRTSQPPGNLLDDVLDLAHTAIYGRLAADVDRRMGRAPPAPASGERMESPMSKAAEEIEELLNRDFTEQDLLYWVSERSRRFAP